MKYLCIFLLTALAGAGKDPIPVPKVDLLELQLLEQKMEARNQAYQRIQAQIAKLQGDMAKVQSEYQSLETERNGKVEAIYKQAKAERSAWDLDLDKKQLIPKTGADK